MPAVDSEFRLYAYIADRLKEVGWDTRSPLKGGQVYTQNEALHDDNLKIALGKGRPENVVVVDESEYWVIEAKAKVSDIQKAVREAKDRAIKINASENVSCKIITGVAGDPDTTRCVETRCLVNGAWQKLMINKRECTGFISPDQAQDVVSSGSGRLDEYEVADELFSKKIQQINEILHNGAIHVKNRAGVLACLLLALANDQRMKLSKNPTTLISDLNARAENELSKHKQEEFFCQIKINRPSSVDNHKKNRKALASAIEELRNLNIASAINSGRDVLGQCYEQFLKYANDAKEIGIVFTPRHITNFAAEVLDIKKNDIVFDPTCGTGGFLVAALDKVRRDGEDVKNFQKGNLHGVEQDASIATLAIVNMVFRGDGSSHIKEGDCLQTEIPDAVDKVLMNPPFALESEWEWRFVNRAIESMNRGGLLFAILPTTAMNSATDGRGEITWRRQLLERHRLIAVIKLAEELFYPQVSKGTYAVVIKARHPHDIVKDKVLWAILNDGITRTKTQKVSQDNTQKLIKVVKNFIATRAEPRYIPEELDCSKIQPDSAIDLSPENHIGRNRRLGSFDLASIHRSIEEGKRKMVYSIGNHVHRESNCKLCCITEFFESIERGKSGRSKELNPGNLPLVSTSEKDNGISSLVAEEEVQKIYPKNGITVSANGSSCYAHYHEYPFAANADVYVCYLKKKYSHRFFSIFMCAAINSENWRYNYFNKLSKEKFESLNIKVPVHCGGAIDLDLISQMVDL